MEAENGVTMIGLFREELEDMFEGLHRGIQNDSKQAVFLHVAILTIWQKKTSVFGTNACFFNKHVVMIQMCKMEIDFLW